MEKVYVIFEVIPNSEKICKGVFSTRKKANKAKKALKNKFNITDEIRIIEANLNELTNDLCF